MAEYNCVFKRIEKKYLLNKKQYEILVKMLEKHMCADEYGKHTICNIYYDTKDFSLIRNSLEKPVYKEKLRVRSYGVPSAQGQVFVEIKKKYKGVVYKRRVSIAYDDAKKLLSGKRQPVTQIENEIVAFMCHYNPQPAAYIAYDRIAYYSKQNSALRVTFDTNIRCRESLLDLTKGAWGSEILGENMYLMEIKIPDAMPLWMCQMLYNLKIFPVSFSKYGTYYKKYLSQKTIIGGHYSA